jgi:hypothetical protein
MPTLGDTYTNTRWRTTMTPQLAALIALTRGECLELLSEGGVGVVAFDRGYGPELLPVTYAADAAELLFRTGTTSRIAHEADGRLIAFETHGLEPALRDGWSVVIRGIAHVSAAAGRAADELSVQPWAPGEHGVSVTMSISQAQITGRRVVPGAGSITVLTG